jgi:predicted ATPase
MIREWRVGQFKSVGFLQSFPMRALTVFTGPNSSGKSSVLQSVLLISQTLSSKVTQRQLVLNGELLKLGTFEDVRSHASLGDEMVIGFTLDVQQHDLSGSPERSTRRRYYAHYGGPFRSGTIDVDLTFGPSGLDDMDSRAPSRSFQAKLITGAFVAEIRREGPHAREGEFLEKVALQIRRRSRDEVTEEIELISSGANHRARFAPEFFEYSANLVPDTSLADRRSRFREAFPVEGQARLISVSLDHFLPSILFVSTQSVLNELNGCFNEIVSTPPKAVLAALEGWKRSPETDKVRALFAQEILGYSESPGNALSTTITELEAVLRGPKAMRGRSIVSSVIGKVIAGLDRDLRNRRDIEPADLPDALALTCASVANRFAALRYLGPLRDDPKPVYGIASSADPSDVGVKGEFTAAVLDLYAHHPVDFVPPDNPLAEPAPIALRDAVHAWLHHFEMAESFTTSEEGKLGHRLMVRPDGVGRDLDLTNVGVGVSQVLPIVVMSLISDRGATLLFEQPELHLHPKVQSLLGDFFLAVIKTGRQCIIETHSEYLINRLRLRTAESPWDVPLHDQLMLYFVERHGETSEFRSVRINEYGAIPDWPRGFFDQGPCESERIMAASLRKSASRRALRQ